MLKSSQLSKKTLKNIFILLAALFPAIGNTAIIVTGGLSGTYYQIGRNLKEIVMPDLELRSSAGSWSNMEAISQIRGVSFAIVQSDVYSAFVRLGNDRSIPVSTRNEYRHLLSSLRVFMPLYREEVHFLVRKNDPMEFIHEIEGKAIWMDANKSGTYLTALNIYAKMFGNELPNSVEPFLNPTATGDDEGTKKHRSALMALSEPEYNRAYPKIDVMVLVGGQPLRVIEKIVPDNLKLLKFDPNHPTASNVLTEYQRAEIRKTSYPLLNIAGEGLPALAVDSYLITAQFAEGWRNRYVEQFATNFCDKFGMLQQLGHPKWNSLAWQPGAKLPELKANWIYASNVRKILEKCHTPQWVRKYGIACPDSYVALGLCK